MKTQETAENIPTLNSESELFLKTVGGGQSNHTFKTYRSGLTYFKQYLTEVHNWPADQPIAQLQPDMFQEFPVWLVKQTYQKTERNTPKPLAESTRALYLLATSRFLRQLVLHKRLPNFDYTEYNRIKEYLNQATQVKAKPIAQKIPGDEIVAALILAAQTPPYIKDKASEPYRRRLTLVWRRNLAILLALKSSGMRVGELVEIKREDLDYERKGAWVTGKGRKTRFVAFDKEAWLAIETYLVERQDEALLGQISHHPVFGRHDRSAGTNTRYSLSVRSVQNIIKDLAEQANVTQRFNISPHSLRHYFANGLLEFTGNLALVQEALGHQDPKTTRIYTSIKVDEIAASVQAMSQDARKKRDNPRPSENLESQS